MSRDTGIGRTSGSLRPGVIAVGVNEELYCLLGGGDLVERLRHDDNCALPKPALKKPAARDVCTSQ